MIGHTPECLSKMDRGEKPCTCLGRQAPERERPELRFDRETTKGLVSFQVRDDHTFIMMEIAQSCGGCGTMHHFAINRGGNTLCVECDKQHEQRG